MFAQSLLFLGKLSGSRVWLSPLGTQIQQLAGYGSSYIDHLHILSLDDFIISRPWPSTWGRPGFPTPVATPPPMARMCNLDVAGVYQKKGVRISTTLRGGLTPCAIPNPHIVITSTSDDTYTYIYIYYDILCAIFNVVLGYG